MSHLTRLTVNLTPRATAALDSAAARTGDNRTDTINQAVIIYDLITELADNGDGKIKLLQADNTPLTVVVT